MYASEKRHNMETVKLTYNARLQMCDTDFKKFDNFLGQAQLAYNSCAEYLKLHNVPLDIKSVHNAVYETMRSSYKVLPAQCVIRIYKEVLAALRSIKSNKHEEAKTPERKNKAMRLDKRLYSNLSKEGIALTGFEKNKRKFFAIKSYPVLDELFSKYTTTDPLVFIRGGEAWLSITFEIPQKPIIEGNAVGIDLGMKRFAVSSDGIAFDDKAYKAKRRQVRYLKSKLKAKCTKSSKRKLKRLKHKERNHSKDFMYRMAKAIIASSGDATHIVLEDLKKIKKNTSKTEDGFKKKRHNNAFSQVALAKFREILTYKAALVGKQVITVSPKWTSQIDSRTSKRDGKRQGCRYYCSDGTVFDADWNAAKNIAIRSKHPTSTTLPIDGKLQFFVGRHQSTCQRGVRPTSL